MATSGTGYEHSGTWECEVCDGEFEVEHKLDVLSHAFSCGTETEKASSNAGYHRRKQELEQYGKTKNASNGGEA